MKSKLLQKINYGLTQSREVVGGQKENIEDSPWKGHVTPPNPVNPTDDAQARKDFPSLLKPKTQFLNQRHHRLRSA
jgi:hypothetical protein